MLWDDDIILVTGVLSTYHTNPDTDTGLHHSLLAESQYVGRAVCPLELSTDLHEVSQGEGPSKGLIWAL